MQDSASPVRLRGVIEYMLFNVEGKISTVITCHPSYLFSKPITVETVVRNQRDYLGIWGIDWKMGSQWASQYDRASIQ